MNSGILWTLFFVVIAAMLAVDLMVVHRRPHAVRMREALLWSGVWVSLALLFNLAILWFRGPQSALEFLTGYLIEESLSVDNLFVFMLIFSYFKVPDVYQHKVLFWGIFGAIAMRLGFIFAGVAMIRQFEWAIYLFGLILIVSGIKMWSSQQVEIQPEKNLVIRLFRRFWPVTPGYEDGRFFVRVDRRRVATPLFVVLLMVETTDLLFAVDSIPAVLAITRDPFIVFSSNAFAILGLRTIYFALAEVIKVFHYLHYGLSLILVFVGIKMVIARFVHVPIGIALGVIAATLLTCVLLSLARPKATALPEAGNESDSGPPQAPGQSA